MPIIPESETDALGYLLIPYSSSYLATIMSRTAGRHVSVRSVEAWKCGRCLPKQDLLAAMAVALEIPVREIREVYTRSKVARRAIARTAQTHRRNTLAGRRKRKLPQQPGRLALKAAS